MRKRPLMALLAAGVVLSYAPAYAAVSDPGPGLICQFSSTEDPTAEPGTQTGQLSGGPLQITDDDGVTPGSGTLTCRVQINQPNHNGTGPQVQGHGTGVVTAGPAQIAYHSVTGDGIYLCGEFTDDSNGQTLYWDDFAQAWKTSTSGGSDVPCGDLATGSGPVDEDPINTIPCPVFGTLPAPLSTTLQDTWADCSNSGTLGAVAVHNIPGTSMAVAVGVNCLISGLPVALVGSNDSVTCVPISLDPTKNVCKTVTTIAAVLPVLPPPPPTSVTGTTTCGALSATASANNAASPLLAKVTRHGTGTFGVTCSWTTVGPPTGWGVVCTWGVGAFQLI